MTSPFLQTHRKESVRTFIRRTLMNCYPMYVGTGGKVLFWSADSQEVHLRLTLNMWTYNLVGTIYGGSLFSASDPFYMLMLYRILGNVNYVVWDKSASIRYRRPAKVKLYAKYLIEDNVIENIKQIVHEKKEIDYTFKIQWIDKNQIVYSEIERVVYIAEREYYHNKRQMKSSQS